MTSLERSTDVTRYLRAINDSVWNLEHNYPTAALAVLRGVLDEERRRTSSNEPGAGGPRG